MKSASAHQEYLRTRFFPGLDGLRCLAIALVVAYHVVGRHSGFAGRGFALFFAISGFIITTLLLHEQRSYGQIAVGRFYVRRVLRMFPLYYAMLALYVILVPFFERDAGVKADFFRNLPGFLTYTSNWFVPLAGEKRIIFYFAWSLATEQQFYLLWPLVIVFLSRGGTVLFLVGMLALSLWVPWAMEAGPLDPSLLWVRILASPPAAICLGCAAAYALQSPAGFRWLHGVLGRQWSAPLALLLVGLAIGVPAAPGWLLALLMVALVVAVCIRARHPLSPFLGFAPVRYLGRVSYGICLVHMLVLNSLRRGMPGLGFASLFPLTLALSVVLAGFSDRYFESRFRAMKKRFAPTPTLVAAALLEPPKAPADPGRRPGSAHRLEPASPAAGGG